MFGSNRTAAPLTEIVKWAHGLRSAIQVPVTHSLLRRIEMLSPSTPCLLASPWNLSNRRGLVTRGRKRRVLAPASQPSSVGKDFSGLQDVGVSAQALLRVVHSPFIRSPDGERCPITVVATSTGEIEPVKNA
jgi:hypothetical protein